MSVEDLQAAADDLDRLEELEPRPGRVGLANRLRRIPDLVAAREARFNYIDTSPESIKHIVAAALTPGDTDE